jgi:hypothetical protein
MLCSLLRGLLELLGTYSMMSHLQQRMAESSLKNAIRFIRRRATDDSEKIFDAILENVRLGMFRT